MNDPKEQHGRREAPHWRARRHLLVALMVAFAAGFGVEVGVAASRDTGAASGSVAATGAADRDARELPPEESRIVATFAPIAVDELPLVDDAPPGDLGNDFETFEELDVALVSVWKGRLAAGQSLSRQLNQQGVPVAVTQLVASQVRPLFDFRRSQPGHRYRLALDPDDNLVDFRYSTSRTDSIHLYWDGSSYVAREEQAELEPRVTSFEGRVDGSLYESIRDQGENPRLAESFASIFAWDIDFTRNVKNGDEFRMVYERLYTYDDDGEEIYVRPGRILAASYRGAIGEYAAVWFESEEGQGSYYRADGSSVERAFLVAPLRYSRISSTFTNARRHPILNVTRRHPGIDYAAAEGTPLWAVAEGTVIYRGWAGDSGNLVKIRHSNGYVSHYAHLSRFAPGLSVGNRVEQKQVIGYVGHTGLATGSHVCFRVTRNGRYVNPLKIPSPSGEPIEPQLAGEFARVRDDLLPDLGIVAVAATDEAL